MELTPQQQKITDYLSDGKWHCMANDEFFMKDDRKRISELNILGFEIIGMKCDKSCGVKHSSRVYMRKMKNVPDWYKPKEVVLDVVGLWYETNPWTGEVLLEYEHEIYA